MATKLGREKTSIDTWRTVYEGTSNACTIPIDNSFNRALRVLIVQKFINNINKNDQEEEECISAPSPIAIFSTTTINESPKKRAKNNTTNIKNHNCGKKCIKCGSPAKIDMPNRMTIGRRIKRFGISIKKFFTEKDCALIVMVKNFDLIKLFLGIIYFIYLCNSLFGQLDLLL